jgi:hypothetical protein
MAMGSGFIADLRERWEKKFSPPPFHGNHLTLVYALTAQDQCVQLVIQGLLSRRPQGEGT